MKEFLKEWCCLKPCLTLKILRIALDYCQYKNQNLNHQDSVKLLTKQVDIMYDKEIFEQAMMAIKEMHDEKI